jgi:hypothetical protein
MKQHILLFLFTLIVISSNGQTYQIDFNDISLWDVEETNQSFQNSPRIKPIAGNNNGRMDFRHSGTGFFSDEICRASAPLEGALCNSWVSEFYFKPTWINDYHPVGSSTPPPTVGQFIFIASEGGDNPYRTHPKGAPEHIYENADMLGVLFTNPATMNFPNDVALGQALAKKLLIVPFAKDGFDVESYIREGLYIELGNDANLTANRNQVIGTTFKITFERLDELNGRLTVFNTVENKIEGTLCFPIPKGIRNLNHVQFMNSPGSSRTRQLFGYVASMTIQNCFKLEDCCFPTSIVTDDYICVPDEVPTTFSANLSPDINFEWVTSEREAITGINDDNSLVVYDWNLGKPHDGGVVEVSLKTSCGCITKEISTSVEISPDLSYYNDFALNASTVYINGVQKVRLSIPYLIPSPPAFLAIDHTWELYEATLNLSGNLVPVGGPIQTLTGDPNVVFADADHDKDYIVIHKASAGGCSEFISQNERQYNYFGRPNGSVEAKLYPNPSSGIVNIEYLGEEFTNSRLIVKNILGQEILNKSIKENLTSIELRDAGIYTVETWEGDKMVSTQKVIIE